MAATSLTTGLGDGNQSTTQTPQSAGRAATGGTDSDKVQSGTPSDILNNQQGIELKPAPLTTVDLNQTATVQAAKPSHPHHINPVLGVFSLALFVVAIALFWITSRSVKKTT